MLSAPARNSSRAASTAHTVQPHLALALLDRRRRAGRHRAGRAASRPPPAAAGERGRAAAGHAAGGDLQGHRARPEARSLLDQTTRSLVAHRPRAREAGGERRVSSVCPGRAGAESCGRLVLMASGAPGDGDGSWHEAGCGWRGAADSFCARVAAGFLLPSSTSLV